MDIPCNNCNLVISVPENTTAKQVCCRRCGETISMKIGFRWYNLTNKKYD